MTAAGPAAPFPRRQLVLAVVAAAVVLVTDPADTDYEDPAQEAC